MKKLIFTALAALTVSAPAMADKWSWVSISVQDVVFYVNLSSIRSTGDNRTTWYAMVQTKDRELADYLVIKERINCNEESSTQLALYIYKDDKIIYQEHNTQPTTSPPPGTSKSVLIRNVCSVANDQDGIEVSSPGELVSHAAELVKRLRNEKQL